MFSSILEILLLVTAVSVDSFAVSFAYGINRVKIPFSSLLILSAISGITLALSLSVGSLLTDIVSPLFMRIAGFAILFALGLVKLFDTSCDAQARHADLNCDKVLSPLEAVSLGIALSLDSIAAGLGIGFSLHEMLYASISAFLLSIAAILTGCLTGRRIACCSCRQFCRIGGILLIVLALFKLAP